MVVLALVLTLVLMLGTVSVAEAKGNPHRSVTVTPIATQGGATYDLSFDLSWEAYRVQRISYTWYQKVGGVWIAWEPLNPSFTSIKALRSHSMTFDYWDFNPQDVAFGEEWKIAVALYKPKGKGYAIVYATDVELVWPT